MSSNIIQLTSDVVTPAARKQPPFAPNIVLRYPTRVYQSDTTVVDQRPLRHPTDPDQNEGRPGIKTGAAFTCLLTNSAYISVVPGRDVVDGLAARREDLRA